MPVTKDGETYYRTGEVCRLVGVSRSTLFRWLKQEPDKEARHRDKRGWRLFTEAEVQRLKSEADRTTAVGK